ncbi:MAG TPA: hypothetical protein VLW45_10985 [Pelomicrobium sp.]|nr:hypothetical protein [Pelomicrobium sp.]
MADPLPPTCPLAVSPGEPLWKRAPSRDGDGRPCPDFMMIIRGLGRRPPAVIEATVNELNAVLSGFADAVVFADLNLRLGVLWVTVRPGLRMTTQIAAAIHARVPEARLVAADFNYS